MNQFPFQRYVCASLVSLWNECLAGFNSKASISSLLESALAQVLHRLLPGIGDTNAQTHGWDNFVSGVRAVRCYRLRSRTSTEPGAPDSNNNISCEWRYRCCAQYCPKCGF